MTKIKVTMEAEFPFEESNEGVVNQYTFDIVRKFVLQNLESHCRMLTSKDISEDDKKIFTKAYEEEFKFAGELEMSMTIEVKQS